MRNRTARMKYQAVARTIGRGGDAESSNCDKDRTSGEWRDYGCPLHGTRCDNQSVWFVSLVVEKVLSILVTLTRFHGVQRISGWQSRMKENLVFRSLVAVNYWQCHMLFMRNGKCLIGSVTNNKLGWQKNRMYSQNWSLFEFQIRSGKDKLGTTDTDFVFITNNEERLRITAERKN
jgi:hypothetical protein